MTFKDLEEKMEKGKIYPIYSKKDDGDGFPGETGCAVFIGRCRLNEDGRLECSVNENADEELPNGNYFFIEKDEDLEPWVIKVGKEILQ